MKNLIEKKCYMLNNYLINHMLSKLAYISYIFRYYSLVIESLNNIVHIPKNHHFESELFFFEKENSKSFCRSLMVSYKLNKDDLVQY